MIRASELYGRSLVDLDTAEKVGTIDEIIVDPYAPCVAGYVVSSGHGLFGGGQRTLVATESVHAIGPDALTIHRTGTLGETTGTHLDTLPRLAELTGRKMVSHGGRLLGTIEDALIDERDGRIVGYPLDANGLTTGFDRIFTLSARSEHLEYVRADADLRVGTKLVIVPDDAIVTVELERLPAPPADTAEPATDEAPPPRRSENKRRQSSSRRAVLATPPPPPIELLPVSDASLTPLPDDSTALDDLTDTTPIAVPGGRGRKASGVG